MKQEQNGEKINKFWSRGWLQYHLMSPLMVDECYFRIDITGRRG